MRIAIQGQAGSFHEQAAQVWFDKTIEIVPAKTFRDAFEHVKQDRAEAVITAIENSLYGSINETYDLVEKYAYPIVGEVHLAIHHQLIGFAGTKLKDIEYVYSQIPALSQCSDYLDRVLPQAERIEHHDTAESVAFIKQLGRPRNAAIASSAAAKLHDMAVIDENIEDHTENYTRFLIMQPNATPPAHANRSSLVLTTSHEPGALAQVLAIFANAGINLSKLQSRPIVGSPWKYKFYLVVDEAGPILHTVLKYIRSHNHEVTVLGEYVSSSDYVAA